MKARWLAGTLLFTLGFGCALMARLPSAAASSTQGVVEGTLKYIDGDDAFQLLYPPGGGDKSYIVLSTRDQDSVDEDAPQVTYQTGGAAFSKKGLRRLVVFRLEPLIAWEGDTLRCGNFPVLCVLPPPPPPPIHYDATVVKPGQYP
jgi:hypothetical protein